MNYERRERRFFLLELFFVLADDVALIFLEDFFEAVADFVVVRGP